jgi:hypothetical protein
MRLPDNIEKSAFPSNRSTPRKQYVGYGRGLVWRIYKNGVGIWEAVDQANGPHFERAGTLAALSLKIADSCDMPLQNLLAYVQGFTPQAWRDGASVVAIVTTFNPATGLIETARYRFTSMGEARKVLEELA